MSSGDHAKLKRDTTIAVTVKEGKQFIGEAETDAAKNGADANNIQRQSTMKATAKEGIAYLKDSGAGVLLEMQGLVQREKSDDEATVKLSKNTTIVATTEEAKALLDSSGGAPDVDARTRGQQKQLDDISKESPPPKKLKRDTTVQQTTEDAKFVVGDEVLAETRAKTAQLKEATADSPPKPKRTVTMAATVKEGEAFVNAAKTKKP